MGPHLAVHDFEDGDEDQEAELEEAPLAPRAQKPPPAAQERQAPASRGKMQVLVLLKQLEKHREHSPCREEPAFRSARRKTS